MHDIIYIFVYKKIFKKVKKYLKKGLTKFFINVIIVRLSERERLAGASNCRLTTA